MRPSVPHVPQLADECPLGLSERLLESDVPLVPHDPKHDRDVPSRFGFRSCEAQLLRGESALRLLEPVLLVLRLEFALDEGM